MKILKTALAAVMAAALLACPALAISLEPGTGEAFYVQDTANVLSAATQDTVAGYNSVLEQQCSQAQLVVATVSYLEEDSQLAATQLMNDWGVGSRSESNGMLLLLVANEHRGWLAVGDGLDGAFTDHMAEEYLDDYFWDYIDEDQFDDGVLTLTNMLYQWYLDYYDVPEAAGALTGDAAGRYDYDYDSGHYYEERSSGGDFMALVVLILLLAIIWISIANSHYRRMRGWGYTGGFWPVFWFGGPRYRDWYRRQPPGPRPPRGPGGFGPGPGPRPPRGGRPGPGFSSRGSRPGGFGGGFHGGGFGGHSGGGGGGRH